jgi:hypothetical protein
VYRPGEPVQLREDTRAAIRAPDGSWSPAATLTGRISSSALAVASDGSAIVVGQSRDGTWRVAPRPAGGTFAPSVALTPLAANAITGIQPEAIATPTEFVAAWQQEDEQGRDWVMSLAAPIGGPFGPPKALTGFPAGFSGERVNIATNRAGLVALAWYTGNGGVAQVALRHPGASFQRPITIGRADITTPKVAVCDDGLTYVGLSVEPRVTNRTITHLYEIAGAPRLVQTWKSPMRWFRDVACAGKEAIAIVEGDADLEPLATPNVVRRTRAAGP